MCTGIVVGYMNCIGVEQWSYSGTGAAQKYKGTGVVQGLRRSTVYRRIRVVQG